MRGPSTSYAQPHWCVCAPYTILKSKIKPKLPLGKNSFYKHFSTFYRKRALLVMITVCQIHCVLHEKYCFMSILKASIKKRKTKKVCAPTQKRECKQERDKHMTNRTSLVCASYAQSHKFDACAHT